MLEEAILVVTGFGLANEGSAVARELYLFTLAVLVWAGCAYTVWNYDKGQRAVRLFENGIKVLSALVVLSFAWVVVMASLQGDVNWAAVLKGFVPHSLPGDAFGVTTMMAALGTAVGINMTFVYGYTLLRRGWRREHRSLARTDIVIGLVVPYLLVTMLISIAAGGGPAWRRWRSANPP